MEAGQPGIILLSIGMVVDYNSSSRYGSPIFDNIMVYISKSIGNENQLHGRL